MNIFKKRRKTTMLKAILFDLDNTLISWGEFFGHWQDIEMTHLQGVYRYFCEVGEPSMDFDALMEHYSQRTKAAFEAARETLIAPHIINTLADISYEIGIPKDRIDKQAIIDAYDWHAMKEVSVFPDVFEALTILRDRGLRFGIVTNSAHPMILRDVEMDDFGLLEYFPECRFAAADVGYFKPHPSIFQVALDCLGTTAEDTIFIGDNLRSDIFGAQQMGMKAVLRDVGENRLAPQHTADIVPDATITSLLELPGIIDEWFPNGK
jgi:putative hydrolase of the HAD superfamily